MVGQKRVEKQESPLVQRRERNSLIQDDSYASDVKAVLTEQDSKIQEIG
jgi:hypothetical protein